MMIFALISAFNYANPNIETDIIIEQTGFVYNLFVTSRPAL